jgi:hypothetical protein
VTRAHGIAWPNHLIRQGVAATVLSGVGWALLIGIGTGHGVCLYMSVAILRVWR